MIGKLQAKGRFIITPFVKFFVSKSEIYDDNEAINFIASITHRYNVYKELVESLTGLLNDIQEYQHINNLGGENNHWQVQSKNLLKQCEAEDD